MSSTKDARKEIVGWLRHEISHAVINDQRLDPSCQGAPMSVKQPHAIRTDTIEALVQRIQADIDKE